MNIYKISIVSLSLLFLLSVLVATLVTPHPIGADVYFHLDVARIWSRGENGMFSDLVFKVNNFPYPPLFHWLLVPSIWFNSETLWCRILQIILSSFCFIGMLLLVNKFQGSKESTLTGIFLLSNFAFIDALIQCRPQSLDMALMVVFFFCFVAYRKIGLVLSMVSLGWNHGIASIMDYWSVLFYGFKKKGWFKIFLSTVLLLSPIIISTVVFLQSGVKRFSGFETWQEYLIFVNPLQLIPFYSGATLLGFPYIIYDLKNWKKISELEKVMVVSVLGLTVMIPFWSDRFLQYATMQLSCIASCRLAKNRTLLLGFLPFLIMAFVIYQINLWWINLTGNWWYLK
ncbi:MAG: hypothetical protein ACTSSG_11295 [Candidatus Heimdallarchaeaceae archaeon]